MNWRITLAHRGPDQRLIDALADQRVLSTEEREIARTILVEFATTPGFDTVGDAFDRVERMSPFERRRLLNEARVVAGLATVEEVEAQERFRRASDAARLQAGKESPWQLCHAAGCNQVPLGELGIPSTTDVKRWWCPAHRHLAADGDMEPRPSRLRFSPSGAIVELDPEEEARQASEAARRQREYEEELAERRLEAAAYEEHERLREAAFRRELPPGVPG
jgi:hypothetical protein